MAWKNPTPTVDLIIERDGHVVLIRRQNAPLGWALPGGFVDEGETVESAACREAMEETGLEVALTGLLHVYSDPARDPRQHTLSVVFTAVPTPGCTAEPIGADDAAESRLISVDRLREILRTDGTIDGLAFAFDHAKILGDWLVFRDTGIRPLAPVQRQG